MHIVSSHSSRAAAWYLGLPEDDPCHVLPSTLLGLRFIAQPHWLAGNLWLESDQTHREDGCVWWVFMLLDAFSPQKQFVGALSGSGQLDSTVPSRVRRSMLGRSHDLALSRWNQVCIMRNAEEIMDFATEIPPRISVDRQSSRLDSRRCTLELSNVEVRKLYRWNVKIYVESIADDMWCSRRKMVLNALFLYKHDHDGRCKHFKEGIFSSAWTCKKLVFVDWLPLRKAQPLFVDCCASTLRLGNAQSK